mgnify:CR=1 FL=1
MLMTKGMPFCSATCAIATSGALYCWGWNFFGQIGDGTVVDRLAPVPIASLPGVAQQTVDSLVVEAGRLVELGVPGVILFGVPARKDAEGSEAWNPEGIVQVALRELRMAYGSRLVGRRAGVCGD